MAAVVHPVLSACPLLARKYLMNMSIFPAPSDGLSLRLPLCTLSVKYREKSRSKWSSLVCLCSHKSQVGFIGYFPPSLEQSKSNSCLGFHRPECQYVSYQDHARVPRITAVENSFHRSLRLPAMKARTVFRCFPERFEMNIMRDSTQGWAFKCA